MTLDSIVRGLERFSERCTETIQDAVTSLEVWYQLRGLRSFVRAGIPAVSLVVVPIYGSAVAGCGEEQEQPHDTAADCDNGRVWHPREQRCVATTYSPSQDGSSSDRDGDGFTGERDCDDSDPTVYLGAFDIADGKVNDCTGTVVDPWGDRGSWIYGTKKLDLRTGHSDTFIETESLGYSGSGSVLSPDQTKVAVWLNRPAISNPDYDEHLIGIFTITGDLLNIIESEDTDHHSIINTLGGWLDNNTVTAEYSCHLSCDYWNIIKLVGFDITTGTRTILRPASETLESAGLAGDGNQAFQEHIFTVKNGVILGRESYNDSGGDLYYREFVYTHSTRTTTALTPIMDYVEYTYEFSDSLQGSHLSSDPNYVYQTTLEGSGEDGQLHTTINKINFRTGQRIRVFQFDTGYLTSFDFMGLVFQEGRERIVFQYVDMTGDFISSMFTDGTGAYGRYRSSSTMSETHPQYNPLPFNFSHIEHLLSD